MSRNYYVSYICNIDGKTIIGSNTILYSKIKSMDDVKKIENSLTKHNKMDKDSLNVLWWQKL